ncbi:MAG TPA: hypothetical protein EYH34_18390 [Planctomycetes bacterium]|nr:hypothetical protein [Planctomycetota bacterium]
MLGGRAPTRERVPYDSPGIYTARLVVSDGVNTPVVAEVAVEVTADTLPPAPLAGTWRVVVPFLLTEFSVRFEDWGGILLVETRYDDGSSGYGLGMESDGVIFWMNLSGSLYFGNIDRDAGTMSGIVFGGPGGSSIWFGQRQ